MHLPKKNTSYYQGFMNYINDIIEESIGLQFKPSKEHHTYSIIPIEELASIMNIINSRELNIFNEGNGIKEFVSK